MTNHEFLANTYGQIKELLSIAKTKLKEKDDLAELLMMVNDDVNDIAEEKDIDLYSELEDEEEYEIN